MIDELRRDLAAEQADLLTIVSPLPGSGWSTRTPAEGWDVRDQIAHLAYFDGTAALAMTDADGFQAELDRALSGDPGYEASTLRRDLDGPGILARWREQSARLHSAIETLAAAVDPGRRVPWYGPPMSGSSLVTARIMETWAHGQDVVDGLGVTRPVEVTPRLRHIAHLGVRTFRFSFTVRGLEAPDTEVFVDLTGAGGERWTWGPEASDDRVAGPALDFCLVVTQRRHLDDTSLVVSGPVATRWMSVAQAFAGPPSDGRPPLS